MRARPITVTFADLALLDARLACGDFEGVLATLLDADAAAALPLFLARYVRWSGDLHAAAAIWGRVLAALDLTLSELGDEYSTSLRRGTCTELAPVATDLGDVQLAARLHGIARTAETAPIPVEGAADALVIRDAAFHTIGIDPDAARGRLRLRPRLDRMDELRVRGIRFGDGSISLSADRSDSMLTIRVQQDAGSIPVTVLLEPFLLEPGSATMDGQPAELVAQNVADGTILPVQLVLDETRTMVVDTRRAVAD